MLTQATYTTNIVDGVLSFTSTGADANNTKKNMGLYHALDGDVASGRYRISFKVMIDAGGFSVLLGDAVNSTTTVFKNSISLLKLDGTTVTSYQATTPSVTLSAEGEPQAKVNAGRWVDVDLIVDRDNAQAWISVGGSEYVEWRDEDFIPGSFAGLTWKYFGLSLPAQQSTFGYVDDVKILKLAPVKSTSDKYTIKTWDDFTDGDDLSFALTGSDSRSSDGLVWVNSANKSTNEKIAYGKYIAYTPERDGLLVLKFSVDNVVEKREPTLCVNTADAAWDCMASTALAKVKVTSAETEYILKADLEAGTTYYIWPYSYNWEGGKFYHNYTITSVAYIYETPHERVFDVAAGATEACAEVLAERLDFIKTGEGTLRLVGNNSFVGDVRVNAGTLRLEGPYEAVGTMIAHYEGNELEATNQFVTAAAVTRPLHTFMVWNPSGVEGDYYTAMSDYNNSLWCVRKRGQNDGYWQVRNYNTWTRQVAVNGSGDAAKSGLQLLEVTTGDWVRNATGRLAFGSGKENALHEIVLYSTALTDEQQALMETYLMAKWGIGAATYTQLPEASSVSVAAGATLDLGAARPVVSRVTLAAGSVLAVDAVHSGEKLLTAQTIVNDGAVLMVGGKVSSCYGLAIVNNPGGMQSLVAQRRGLLVVFQ